MTDASSRPWIDDLRAVVADAEALMAAADGEASEQMGDIEFDLSARAEAVADEARRFVRDNPWQALGVAAVAGLVVGLMIGRR